VASADSAARRTQKPGVVIDASVVLKLLLPEERSDTVRHLWARWVAQDVEIMAPFLLAYEVISVLRNKVFRGELPPEAGEAVFVEERAWKLAKQWNLPTGYDAAYLALAEMTDYNLWTADRRCAAVLRKKVRRIRLIGR